jgi:hypothetical protein
MGLDLGLALVKVGGDAARPEGEAMPTWTATRISARQLLWLGVITVVLVTAPAGPAIAAPPSAVGPAVAGDRAGRSSQWIARPPLRYARGGLGVAKVGRQILAIGGFDDANTFDVRMPATATSTLPT